MTRQQRGHLKLHRRLVVVLMMASGIMVSAVGPALAHAAYVASQPAAGSNLATPVGVVTIRFTEPLIKDLSSATVTDPNGTRFTGGPVDDRHIEIRVASSASGEYLVAWKSVSPVDGHTLRGGFSYGVGADPEAQEPAAELRVQDRAVGLFRAVEYTGLLAVLGMLSLASHALGVELDWVPSGLRRWVMLAAVGGVGTVVGEIFLATDVFGVASVRAFLLAPSGIPRVARVTVEVAAAVLAWRVGRHTGGVVPRRAHRVVVTVATLGALALLSASGHAAAGGALGVLADVGHLWAAGIWAGALVVMAMHRPPGGWRSETGRQLLAEFSPVAMSAFVATVVLGTVRGWQELEDVADLWTSGYGTVLSMKIVVVAAMTLASFAAWRRQRLRPRTEAGLAVVVLLLAGVLAAFPVPPGRAGDEVAEDATTANQGLPQQGDLTVGVAAGTTVVGLSLRPAEPGINDLYVHLVPISNDGRVDEVTVEIQIDDAATVEMRACGSACRVATATLQGDETVTFTVSGVDSSGGTAAIVLPSLPARDGRALLTSLTRRMKEVKTLRFDEVFGPVEPPVTSSWEIINPHRLHGLVGGAAPFRETIRIDDRKWFRESPDGPWQGGEPGGPTVQTDRYLWDYPDRIAPRIVGEDIIDGHRVDVLTFYVEVSDLPIWYRLWVDGDAVVRRAEMRTQGHFMDRDYHDVDEPLIIEPPTPGTGS